MKTSDFVKKAIKLHGNRYDYSLTEFVDWKTPLKIICSVHGTFDQWPYTHLKGSGCKRCKGKEAKEVDRKKAADTFIEKAIKKHGKRYDYSKTIYISSKENVLINCLAHGEFPQKASNHLMGKGCPDCSFDKKKSIRIDNLKDLQNVFIEKSLKIHRGYYSYEKVVYVDSNSEVEITCPIHGSFFQRPYLHSKGSICKACSDKAKGERKRLKAAQEFVERCKKLHGDKYDYSKARYKKSSEKVEIICLKHGPFKIRPNSFLQGVGCDKCGTESMASKQATGIIKFIEQSKKVHRDKYDYSQVEYKSTHTHVIIACPHHGPFPQAPSGHIAGRGCPLCGIKKCAENIRHSLEIFIKKAKEIHGEKYDYSHANYINSSSNLTIICSIHGPFPQTPAHHIHSNQGCPSCANRDMTTEKFIERAKEKHKNKYDYSTSVYKTARGFIDINCLVHGIYPQRAWNHLNGNGCPLCVDAMNSRGVRRIEAWLQKNDILFEREKTFPDLVSSKKGKKSLRFDFYIPGLEVLIEFDGQQHFEANDHWGGEKAFLELIANDKKKNEWVKNKKYILTRISYLEEERIEDILAAYLIEKNDSQVTFD